jgi:NADH:ubiquinone oxidoreductase subunit E
MTLPRAPLEQILAKYPPKERSLIMVLQDVQEAYRHLPLEILVEVAKALGVPKGRVFGVATFYKAFSMEPRGEVDIRVCRGTACHVRGGLLIMDEFKRLLGIDEGQTTSDGKYTLEAVNCVGACAMAPVVVVNDTYYGSMSVNKLNRILKATKSTKAADAAGEETE